ncbi:HBL302Cp [Eremothecium sinecaudum]|uniref:prephenate dehydratase n=1 Tax=Eremothecium sinecaudum TaxID=45286 RepID=A0A120K0R3_9SACH|nr:HBL302Cp [Eremothecium sinecaudum]AMD18600.1 HBL302Cp [Eremothecium sinecaudum]
MVKVAFLGPLSTYSHEAALQHTTDVNAELIPVSTIGDCFAALKAADTIDLAVVPLENSTNGQVVSTYDLLRDDMLEATTEEEGKVEPELVIVGQQFVSIVHCLISPVPLSIEDLKNIKPKCIYSHPQVWGQVTKYLKQLHEAAGLTLSNIDTNSTTSAVVQVKKQYEETGTISLAIASRKAASVNGAYIIEENINDAEGNITRFLVLQRRSKVTFPVEPQSPQNHELIKMIAFTTERDAPGSLSDVLSVFKKHEINMCSIMSRPYCRRGDSRKWQYVFFIEYEDKEYLPWDQIESELTVHCQSWCQWGQFYRDSKYY